VRFPWATRQHRLFAFITQNWRGKPLVSHAVIIQLIGGTTTETGLQVRCEIDHNLYPKGVQVTEQEMQAINLMRNDFHGEWNYTIAPNQQPP
jgi:Rhodopirellula transposase DDE domain